CGRARGRPVRLSRRVPVAGAAGGGAGRRQIGFTGGGLERAAGIEPAPKAWKAFVIPFHHARSPEIPSLARVRGQGARWGGEVGHGKPGRAAQLAITRSSGRSVRPSRSRICGLALTRSWIE